MSKANNKMYNSNLLLPFDVVKAQMDIEEIDKDIEKMKNRDLSNVSQTKKHSAVSIKKVPPKLSTIDSKHTEVTFRTRYSTNTKREVDQENKKLLNNLKNIINKRDKSALRENFRDDLPTIKAVGPES